MDVKEESIEWSPTSMLEVTINQPDDFLKVRETLTRIGVASRKDKKLFQSCHILHKQGRYFIVHFKELFMLDGKKANLELNDIARRNTIATLLSDWGIAGVDSVEPQDPRGETLEDGPSSSKSGTSANTSWFIIDREISSLETNCSLEMVSSEKSGTLTTCKA